MTWREDAACRGMSVNRFVFDTTNAASLVAAAKAVCATCPAYCREQCLEGELDRMRREEVPTVGVYGGLDQWERIELLNPGRPAPRRARVGRPDKAKERSKRWLRELKAAALQESWALRRALWTEQQASA